MSVTVVTDEGSILIGRRVDLASGTLSLEMVYSDVDGNQIETMTTESSQPTILARYSLESGVPIEETPPSAEPPSDEEQLDDFSDLLPSSETSGSSEGVGSFF